jgi:hypothetical protein
MAAEDAFEHPVELAHRRQVGSTAMAPKSNSCATTTPPGLVHAYIFAGKARRKAS